MRRIELPRSVYIGSKVYKKIAQALDEFLAPLIVTGKNTYKIYGSKVEKETGFDCEIIEKKHLEGVNKVRQMIREGKYDIVIAVGGGSIIDVVKYATFLESIPFASVPTTCSNDGIASPRASFKQKDGAVSKGAHMPFYVFVDLDIMKKVPERFVQAGFGDMIAKFTAVHDWKLGHVIKGEYFGDYASNISLMVARMMVNFAEEIRDKTDRGINVLMEALISSGAAMGIAGSSRPASGSEHKFAHALDLVADYPSLHGIECGIGTIVMSYLQGQDFRMIKRALQRVGAPTTCYEIGVEPDKMVEALLKAKEIRPERYTIIEHINLNETLARKALQVTGVI